MHIERLQIEGFGHYADHPLDGFDKALTIIRGRNEAGKSTLLAFLRAVLFGFPTRLGAQHYPPMRGGRHGGRIVLRLADGRGFTVERTQGAGNGPFKAWGDDGNQIDEKEFSRIIGNASETLFRSAFTFDLDDLPRFDVGGGDLGSLLYGVSLGAAQLPQAMKRLDGQIEGLFVPRGSAQKIPRLLADISGAEKRLREVAGQADEYRRRTERRGQILSELEAAQALLASEEQHRRESERHKNAWEDWTSLRVTDERLASLEATGAFPPNALATLERAEQDLRDATVALEEAATALGAATVDADRPFPDAELLDLELEIEGLRRGRNAVDGSLRDLPERRAELAGREKELHGLLKTLGPDWDEDRLFALDLSIVRRAEIDQWQQRFQDSRTDLRDRERDLQEATRQSTSAAEMQKEADAERERLGGVPDEEALLQRRTGLHGLRDAHDRYERSRQRLSDLEAQQPLPAAAVADPAVAWLKWAAAALGLALLAGAIGSIFAGEDAIAGFLGIVGAASLTAGVVALRSRPTPLQAVARVGAPSVDEAREELASAEAALRQAAAGVIEGFLEGSGVLPDSDAIRVADEALDRLRMRTVERTQAFAAATKAERLLGQATRRSEEAAEAVEKARAASEQLSLEWNAWINAGDLPMGLEPSTAGQLITNVEVARAKAEELRQFRLRVDAIGADIQQYRARVEPVAQTLGMELADAERAAAEVADALIDRFEAARDGQTAQELARVRETERKREHDRAQTKAAEAEQALAALLKAGGVKTAEQFQVRAGIHEQRGGLQQERDACEMRLRQLIGPDPEALAGLDQALGATTLEEIEATLTTAEQGVAEAEVQRDALLHERGKVTAEIQQLDDDDAASEARATIASLRAEIVASAREWSSLVIARALLRQTRDKYERERQPEVIKRASSYFATLTGGRYQRVFRPVGEGQSSFTVVDRDESTKTPGQLSRGTKEQLYLALRLGAIEEAAATHESLPVIVDEVLVNFDPERASRAAEAFVDLANRTQVIVFTCHPWIADLFADVVGGVPIIALD